MKIVPFDPTKSYQLRLICCGCGTGVFVDWCPSLPVFNRNVRAAGFILSRSAHDDKEQCVPLCRSCGTTVYGERLMSQALGAQEMSPRPAPRHLRLVKQEEHQE